MRDGVGDVSYELDLNVESLAYPSVLPCLPMDALHRVGELAIRRLTLLRIGARVIAELRLANVFDHLHMAGAIRPRIWF